MNLFESKGPLSKPNKYIHSFKKLLERFVRKLGKSIRDVFLF